jgi:general secretion pathway protein K
MKYSNGFPLGHIHDQQGVALVVVLLALVLLTAMVVEFSYGVYTGTNDLYNWRDAQRLSVMAKSGVNVSANLLSNKDMVFQYTESIEMPIENPFEDFNGIITVRIEDENAKININSIVTDQGNRNDVMYIVLKSLLKLLGEDERISDRIVDWIDPDSIAYLSDSEAGAKNAALQSVDELLLIHGISRQDYDKLLPYITVYGNRNAPGININRAEKEVIMSLAGIDEGLAQRVIDTRKGNPLDKSGELDTIIGSGKIPAQINIRFDGTIFSIKSTASSGGVKRVIETVLDTTTTNTVQYWKEY